MAWKLGFKLWWTSPSRLITSLAVIAHYRKWTQNWPVYIFYVCLQCKLPYQYIQSNKTFQKHCGNNSVSSSFKVDFYHIFSSSHIWTASKASQNIPHYHHRRVRACPLSPCEIWWWKKRKLSLLNETWI